MYLKVGKINYILLCIDIEAKSNTYLDYEKIITFILNNHFLIIEINSK